MMETVGRTMRAEKIRGSVRYRYIVKRWKGIAAYGV